MDWIGLKNIFYGARGRNRTGTAVKPRDFKSLVSTNFTTRARWVEARAGVEPA